MTGNCRGIVRSILFLAMFVSLASRGAFAQVQTGTILGTVTDSSGGSIAGATVRITNQGTAISREFKADEQGRYAAPDLPIGTYDVEVSHKPTVRAVGQQILEMASARFQWLVE